MRTPVVVIAFSLVAGCGEPLLANAPRPNPAVVAGAAAAVAGAATLADPNGQAKRSAEANKPSDEKKPQKAGPTVPADVLDRLEKDPTAKNQPQPQPQPPPQDPVVVP